MESTRVSVCCRSTADFIFVRSQLYRRRFLHPSCHFSHFSRSRRSILPRWGKKNNKFVFPPKNTFGKSAKEALNRVKHGAHYVRVPEATSKLSKLHLCVGPRSKLSAVYTLFHNFAAAEELWNTKNYSQVWVPEAHCPRCKPCSTILPLRINCGILKITP